MTTFIGSLTASFIAGCLSGFLYFGGLWWTVRRVVASERPVLITVLSWLVRVGFVLTVFALITGDSWHRPAVALLGFILARVVVIRFVAGGLSDGH